MNDKWVSRSFPKIMGSSVVAGIPGNKPEWQMTVQGGNNKGNLVDDMHYYHDSGAKLIAYALPDGSKRWEISPEDLETYGDARMISDDMLVTVSAATIRDRRTGNIIVDLRSVLDCPDPNGTFGASSYGYFWKSGILLHLQKPSYSLYRVDSHSFEVREQNLKGTYIMADTDEYAVLLNQAAQDAIEVYRKEDDQHLWTLKDPSFEFGQYRTKYTINGNRLLTGTKSATDFILWDLLSGEKAGEIHCPYPEGAIVEESRLGNLDSIITDAGDFLIFRHYQKNQKDAQFNQIWRLESQNGEATLCCEFDRRFRTESGIIAGDIIFLDKQNDDGSFSPCAIDRYTGQEIWEFDHASRFGYEIHLSTNHVVFTEKTPNPCEVLCFGWRQAYANSGT